MKRIPHFRRLLSFFLCLFLMLPLLSGLPVQAADSFSAQRTAELLVRTLSTEQKIGQMIMPAFQTWSDGKTSSYVTVCNAAVADAIRTYGFGGVALFSDNLTGTAQGVRLIADMQQAALSSKSGLPLLVGADQEGGTIYRLRTGTELCGNMALGAAGDPALAKDAAAVIGSECAAMGINIPFAPVLDVNSNPDNPIIGLRSFSDDPALTAALGCAYIEGLHSAGVASTVKHFPGHGDTAVDSHSGLPCIDKSLAELKKTELVPFQAAIDAGADMVMLAHNQFPQIEKTTYASVSSGRKLTLPASLSKTIITDLLRGEMGFTGVVCTDALGMGAITANFSPTDAARLAINAGADILLMPMTLSCQADLDKMGAYIDALAGMVKKGEIQESTVDAAVTRILKLKAERGILDTVVNKNVQVQKALSVVGSKAHHDTEWAIMKQAVTLVKNDKSLLPVSVPENGKIAMFCSYPNEVPMMEYGIERLKADGFLPKSVECSVFCYNGHTVPHYANSIRNADFIVGSVESYSSADLRGGWQADFIDGLINAAHTNGKKIAVVSIQLPYDLARYQKADALLAVYNSEGMNACIPTVWNGETRAYGVNLSAAVYTIFGGNDPSGTLPVDIPMLDANKKYTKTVLYSRGFGLSYAGEIKKTPVLPAVPFSDVPKDSYYTKAVAWAASTGVTGGTGDNRFSPDRPCTRAEIVTFLWRAAGSPKVSAVLPFRDVPAGSYYADAVKWAFKTGVTGGTDSVTFSPDMPCTRAQAVTFLARLAGVEDASVPSSFTDVSAKAYYAAAVRWAADTGVTGGTGNGRFSPDRVCTRAEIVTFLYRYAGK